MSYVICRLCRAKVSCTSTDDIPERCPKCQGKLPRDLKVSASDSEASAEAWLCPSCLGRLAPAMLTSAGDCPICGQPVDRELATTLGKNAENIIRQPTLRLIDGDSASDVAASLQAQGISSEQAWRCIDRLIAELPFERKALEDQGHTPSLAPACDACGIITDLAMYDAEWALSPDELKRYREGYAGFDGQFADSKTYTRHALYCLCKKCYKRAGKSDFADGYPFRFGFILKRIKKRK
ncbi:hypothetical protein IJT17_02795 [bacterium]|nr:hypothetical protein [bacterium]